MRLRRAVHFDKLLPLTFASKRHLSVVPQTHPSSPLTDNVPTWLFHSYNSQKLSENLYV